jgi:Sulfotransferase family
MNRETSHDQRSNYKYVFVCGLQRSGTSVLGRNIARLEDCTGFKNTGVLMDEGQFLQNVYPIDQKLGGAGRFGFNSRAHRTETSALLTPGNIARLRASWHAHWDASKSICVEKTPANLLMTRFLQEAFPDSYFVVIIRHPVPVSMASQRWKVGVSPLYRLFEHWLHCHKLFEQDRKYLKHVYKLRYEEYVDDPDKYHQEIAVFIGTRVAEPTKQDNFYYVTQWRNPTGLRVPKHAMEGTSQAHNEKYFNRWRYLLERSLFRHYYRYIANKYEPRFAEYGYSLIKGCGVSDDVLNSGAKISAVLGPAYCLGASVFAFSWRLAVRTKGYTKRGIKRLLPELVLNRVRQVRQKVAAKKDKASVLVPQRGD